MICKTELATHRFFLFAFLAKGGTFLLFTIPIVANLSVGVSVDAAISGFRRGCM